MSRREMREHIFRLLFMGQFHSEEEMTEQLPLYFEELDKETYKEPTDREETYMKEKYALVVNKLPEIDELLNATSKGWKTSRMNRVDLTVLRLAVYELKYDEEVPTGVAINEAVELAKKFGGETSSSFVNGILGKIAKGADSKEALS